MDQRKLMFSPTESLFPSRSTRVLEMDSEISFPLPRVKLQPKKQLLAINWNPAPIGWYKLNTDGSSLVNPGAVGASGVI